MAAGAQQHASDKADGSPASAYGTTVALDETDDGTGICLFPVRYLPP